MFANAWVGQSAGDVLSSVQRRVVHRACAYHHLTGTPRRVHASMKAATGRPRRVYLSSFPILNARGERTNERSDRNGPRSADRRRMCARCLTVQTHLYINKANMLRPHTRLRRPWSSLALRIGKKNKNSIRSTACRLFHVSIIDRRAAGKRLCV